MMHINSIFLKKKFGTWAKIVQVEMIPVKVSPDPCPCEDDPGNPRGKVRGTTSPFDPYNAEIVLYKPRNQRFFPN